jgi:kynureninase
MVHPFQASSGAEGWQLSNPPIFSLAAIRASLDVFSDAGFIQPLRQKSELLTGYLRHLLQEELGAAVKIITPEAADEHGCQLSLCVQGGKAIYEKLDEAGVVSDWREPDVIRVAPVPLYNSFEDCYRFVTILKSILGNEKR